MPSRSRIGIGAIITAIGLAALFYTMPIVSKAAASNGPVFKEDDVPKYPDNMRMYIPMELGSIGVVIAGVGIMGSGFGDKPLQAQRKITKADRKTKAAGAA